MGNPGVRAAPGGIVALRHGAHGLQRAEPVGEEPLPGRRAESLERLQLAPGGHVILGAGGDVDDRRVVKDPSRGAVPTLRDGVALKPQRPCHRVLARGAQRGDPGEASPRIDPGLWLSGVPGERVGELLACPLIPADLGELLLKDGRQLNQVVHVQRRIGQPRLRQGPLRPVVGGVGLAQPHAQLREEEGAQAGTGLAQEPGRQLRVEDAGGDHADAPHAGEILAGRVDDPGGVPAGLHQRAQIGCAVRLEGDGIDQPGARPLAPDLEEVGLRPVAVAVRALCVERHRALGRAESGQALVEGRALRDDRTQGLSAVFDVGHERRPRGSGATPGGSGGWPATCPIRSSQAARCVVRECLASSVGVQEQRSSTSARSSCDISPNPLP